MGDLEIYAWRGEDSLERPFPATVVNRPASVELSEYDLGQILGIAHPTDDSFGVRHALAQGGPGPYIVCAYPLPWREIVANYDHPPYSPTPLVSPASKGVLEEFCGIANSEFVFPQVWFRHSDGRQVPASPIPPAAIEGCLRFARRWGRLGLCPHGLPEHSANVMHGKYHDGTWRRTCPLLKICDHRQEFPEPLDAWVALARQAKAILRLTTELEDGQGGNSTAWEALNAGPDGLWGWRNHRGTHNRNGTVAYDEIPDTETAAAWRWSEITGAVNRWLQAAHVGPSVARTPGSYSVTLGGNGLLGALGIQLMMAISPSQWRSRLSGVAHCSHCGEAFQPMRRLRRRQNNFCPDCRADPQVTRVRNATASRAYRDRRHQPAG
jgi:hypothetical protein